MNCILQYINVCRQPEEKKFPYVQKAQKNPDEFFYSCRKRRTEDAAGGIFRPSLL
jgi:hypothetical protein